MVDDNQNNNLKGPKKEIKPQKVPNIPGLSDLGNISEEKWKVIFHHFRIGEHMLQRKIITITKLAEILEEQKETGEQLGEIVIRKGIITRQELLNLLMWQHKADQVIMNLLIDMEDEEKKNEPKE